MPLLPQNKKLDESYPTKLTNRKFKICRGSADHVLMQIKIIVASQLK